MVTEHVNTPYLRPSWTRFGSEEARVFLQSCSNFKLLKQIHARKIRFGQITNHKAKSNFCFIW